MDIGYILVYGERKCGYAGVDFVPFSIIIFFCFTPSARSLCLSSILTCIKIFDARLCFSIFFFRPLSLAAYRDSVLAILKRYSKLSNWNKRNEGIYNFVEKSIGTHGVLQPKSTNNQTNKHTKYTRTYIAYIRLMASF